MDFSKSSIHKLPFDVLAAIFSLNTGNQDECRAEWHNSALHFLLISSQVCRSWRTIILASPSIWGNSMILDFILPRSKDWVDFLIQRSGNAPIRMKGTVDPPKSALDNQCPRKLPETDIESLNFCHLLSQTWFRIKDFDVLMYHPNIMPSVFWEILRQPAPLLEGFFLRFEDYHTALHDAQAFSPHSMGFTDDAPVLQRFYSQWLDIHPDQSWIGPQLSKFAIYPTIPRRMTTPRALEMLAKIPSVDTLSLVCVLTKEEPRSSISTPFEAHIPFPCLKTFTIRGHAGDLSLFSALEIPPRCGLLAEFEMTPETSRDPNVRSSFHEVVSRYIERHFTAYPAREMRLTSGLSVCSLSDFVGTNPDDPSRHFHITIFKDTQSDETTQWGLPYSLVFDAMRHTSSLTTITSLTLLFDFALHFTRDFHSLALLDILIRMPVIEVLETTITAISMISMEFTTAARNDIENRDQAAVERRIVTTSLLPVLKIIKVKQMPVPVGDPHAQEYRRVENNLWHFLGAFVVLIVKSPVLELIDLTDFTDGCPKFSWTELEECQSLRVEFWITSEEGMSKIVAVTPSKWHP